VDGPRDRRLDHYPQLVDPLPDGVELVTEAEPGIPMAHLFTTARAVVQAEVVRLKDVIAKNGMIWVSWPKTSSKVPSEVTEDTIREVCLPLGLVDVKVCAVDATWSGLKLMWRKELR
jgi:hypothetical protein